MKKTTTLLAGLTLAVLAAGAQAQQPSRPRPGNAQQKERIQNARQDAQQAERIQNARQDAQQKERIQNARQDARQAERIQNARQDAQQTERIQNARQDARQAERIQNARANGPRFSAVGPKADRSELIRATLNEERIHRERVAKIARLRELADQKGQPQRIEALRDLLQKEDARYQRVLAAGRERLPKGDYDVVRGRLERGRSLGAVQVPAGARNGRALERAPSGGFRARAASPKSTDGGL